MAFALNSNLYLAPTPAGAFDAAAGPADNRLRRFISALFQLPVSPLATEDNLVAWSGLETPGNALDFTWRMQELGWLQALEVARSVPGGPIEEVLAALLPKLTRGGKALLADSQGFYLCSTGFPHEVAEELSALSADLANLHQRRSRSLNANLGLGGSAWGLLDACGQSQIGFWPVHAGSQRFVLVVSGMPSFNRPEVVDLVWVLHQRYALQGKS